ncbi:hypothetical protein EYF80_053856 [Liparis tanakae]|uniref:Uncharacterized protein n=1 Tax=Liparis tanakae TaxID=230148 RepID=A0A4Z2F404_9TELE|nr:hypothetical protein EYF80_053856 [Liparis tanakae]
MAVSKKRSGPRHFRSRAAIITLNQTASASLTSVEARSAHQLRPVGAGPQQSVQRDHRGVVAAASRPARQAEAPVGLVPLRRAVGGGPDHGAQATGDAPQIQKKSQSLSLSSTAKPRPWTKHLAMGHASFSRPRPHVVIGRRWTAYAAKRADATAPRKPVQDGVVAHRPVGEPHLDVLQAAELLQLLRGQRQACEGEGIFSSGLVSL